MMKFVVASVVSALLISALSCVPTVSVEDFGAHPDDGIDDTVAMQAAADYLCAHPGTTLVYPPGVYDVDQLVDINGVFSSDLRDHAVLYEGCSYVTIVGFGAKIDVKGDFTKSVEPGSTYPPGSIGLPDACRDPVDPSVLITCQAVAEGDLFQFTPFAFVGGRHFNLYGFEIDGNADLLQQASPEVYLAERAEYGVWLADDNEDYRLWRIDVHHMVTDGISFSGRHTNGVFRRVRSASNGRNALSVSGGVRNLYIAGSSFLDSGFVTETPGPGSYVPHAPARGVDIEPECTPIDADWEDPSLREASCQIAGNILFERVVATGSYGGQIAFPHGENSANVTVRDSYLQNRPGIIGSWLVNMGVAGGVVEDSVLDAQQGHLEICLTAGVAEQRTSPVFLADLAEMAADPFIAARSIYAETQRFSSTLRNNTILGDDAMVVCADALPYVEVSGNVFDSSVPPVLDPSSFYPFYGVLSVYEGAGCVTGGHDWSEEIHVERNDFRIPTDAARRFFGTVHYCGSHIEVADNTYGLAGADTLDPITVGYEVISSVSNDCFPGDDGLVPIDGYPTYAPIPLGPGDCLDLP